MVVRQNVTFSAMLCRSAKKDGQLKESEKNEKIQIFKNVFAFYSENAVVSLTG